MHKMRADPGLSNPPKWEDERHFGKPISNHTGLRLTPHLCKMPHPSPTRLANRYRDLPDLGIPCKLPVRPPTRGGDARLS